MSNIHSAFTYKKSSNGIKEFSHKKNGLTVLLLEDKSMPVAGVMVTYSVGSRNEATGHTGATHLLEHLMFKGSTKFTKEKGNHYDSILEGLGGIINATTWVDRTNYYAVVPSEHLEETIAPEADRMRNATFTELDRTNEMPVVRSEFEIGENDPLEAFDKQMWATAFHAHPYHHSTIGWRSDIENISIERLRKFYDTFYWPNNATVTIVGGINSKKTLGLIDKHFGKHKSSPSPIPEMYTTEPEQEGVRHAEVNRVGNTNIVSVSHKIPGVLHKDIYALHVLSSILGDGKQSRLYKKLVEKKLASSITMHIPAFKDGSLLQTYVFLNEGVAHKKVLDEVKCIYEEIIKKGITAKELTTTKAHVRSDIVKSRDGAYRMLMVINEAIATGDWTFYSKYQKELEKVTTEDVKRVAKLYFTDMAMTTGYFKSI